MSAVMKNIYATITDHVQMVGYREIVEAHGRARGLAGLVFNDADGSVKIMAHGLEPVLTEFIQDLRSDRPDTIIYLNSFRIPPYNLKSTSIVSFSMSLNPIISSVLWDIPVKFRCQIFT